MKFQFFRLFKRSIYEDFNREKKDLQVQLLQAVDEMGSKVVQNFEENRVLKQKDIMKSELYLGIDDPED